MPSFTELEDLGLSQQTIKIGLISKDNNVIRIPNSLVNAETAVDRAAKISTTFVIGPSYFPNIIMPQAKVTSFNSALLTRHSVNLEETQHKLKTLQCESQLQDRAKYIKWFISRGFNSVRASELGNALYDTSTTKKLYDAIEDKSATIELSDSRLDGDLPAYCSYQSYKNLLETDDMQFIESLDTTIENEQLIESIRSRGVRENKLFISANLIGGIARKWRTLADADKEGYFRLYGGGDTKSTIIPNFGGLVDILGRDINVTYPDNKQVGESLVAIKQGVEAVSPESKKCLRILPDSFTMADLWDMPVRPIGFDFVINISSLDHLCKKGEEEITQKNLSAQHKLAWSGTLPDLNDMSVDSEGRTPAYIAGARSMLADVITGSTKKQLEHCTEGGRTLYHLAAQQGKLDLLPIKDLDKNLLIQDSNGVTPLHLAGRFGNLHQVPEKLLSRPFLELETFHGTTVYMEAINAGHYAQVKEYLTDKLLEPGKDGSTILHTLAKLGYVDQVPQSNLFIEDAEGNTPFSFAITHGAIAKLPPETKTRDNLCNGTLLHKLAELDQLNLISFDLTPADYLRKDEDGNTLLHLVAKHGKLSSLPNEALQEPYLSQKNNKGYIPLHVSLQWGRDQWSMFKYYPMDIVTIEHLTAEVAGTNAYAILAGKDMLSTLPRELISGAGLIVGEADKTAIDALLKNDKLDTILGLELPDNARSKVGDAWWEKNQSILREREKLTQSSANEVLDIDLF